MEVPIEAHPEFSPAEMVEEVDHDGSVMRVVTRGDMRRSRLRHRSVFVGVVSGDGQLLVHRRSGSKDIWPGWWDVAVGGVVAPGETWEMAAERELAEELGVVGAPVTAIGDGAYEDDQVRLICRTFVCRTDGPFAFADGEIIEAHWVDPTELSMWLSSRKFLPDSLAMVLPRIRLA